MNISTLKTGERLLRLSLESNALDYLQMYDDYISKSEKSFSNFKISMISLIGFFESLIKWILTKKYGNAVIWNSDKKPFNEEDFQKGNFHSINLDLCLKKAVQEKMITEDEKKIIEKHELIRNRIIHFGIVGEAFFFDSNALIINEEEFLIENMIIGKLLKYANNLFSKEAKFSYKGLIEKYVN